MTMTDVIILAASAGGVGALVGIAWLLGFRRRARLRDESVVAAVMRAHEPGAEPFDIGMDKNGLAAGARLRDGRFAIARPVADGVAVRFFGADAVRSVALRRPSGGPTARIVFADLGFPPVTLAFATSDFPSWTEALRHATRSA
jgi:hypothetical protein